ncbi:MAG: magnesium transporter [Desulfurivibrionaceae bacterium]|nr:magnesium transporter [Desulfurivibrionaceae bacterium]
MEEAIHDIVSSLRRLDPPQRAEALLDFRPEEALAIFEQLEPSLQEELLQWLPPEKVDQLIMDLDPDDRVRLLDTLTTPVAQALLANLSARERWLTQKLLSYPKESAGHIMTPEYLALSPSLTVAEALDRIRRQGHRAGTLHVLPVLDDDGRLLGLLTLCQLVLADADQEISGLMVANVPRTTPETDQEEVARLIQAADLLALPVVDASGRLLGLVTVDDALDVIHYEREEDFARAAATEPLRRPYFSISVFELTRSRLVWLTLLAIAGTLTVQVLNIFEGLLEQVVTLSLFIPLLIGVGGNSGAQAATTVTRAIATDDVAGVAAVILRETRVGLLLGGALGLLTYLPVLLIFDGSMAAIVSLTLVVICTLATLVGSGMPLLARRLDIDPAVVSAPVVTTVVDASGLVVYFLIAKAVMDI